MEIRRALAPACQILDHLFPLTKIAHSQKGSRSQRDSHKEPQDRPKRPQDGPKSPSDRPKIAPRSRKRRHCHWHLAICRLSFCKFAIC